VQWFRGGLKFKAHRLLYHPTLGSRVIKKKKRTMENDGAVQWFRGGLVFEAHTLVSLSLRLKDRLGPVTKVKKKKKMMMMELQGRERIFIELMTSDRKLQASREGSK